MVGEGLLLVSVVVVLGESLVLGTTSSLCTIGRTAREWMHPILIHDRIRMRGVFFFILFLVMKRKKDQGKFQRTCRLHVEKKLEVSEASEFFFIGIFYVFRISRHVKDTRL